METLCNNCGMIHEEGSKCPTPIGLESYPTGTEVIENENKNYQDLLDTHISMALAAIPSLLRSDDGWVMAVTEDCDADWIGVVFNPGKHQPKNFVYSIVAVMDMTAPLVTRLSKERGPMSASSRNKLRMVEPGAIILHNYYGPDAHVFFQDIVERWALQPDHFDSGEVVMSHDDFYDEDWLDSDEKFVPETAWDYLTDPDDKKGNANETT